MTKARTTGSFVDDLNKLVKPRPNRARDLTDFPDVEVINSGVGEALLTGSTGDAGISSPLSEPDASTRTYHPVSEIASSDGVIIMEVTPINSVDMVDGAGRAVQFIYDDPSS